MHICGGDLPTIRSYAQLQGVRDALRPAVLGITTWLEFQARGEAPMSAKPHEVAVSIRNLLAMTRRISQSKKTDPADLQQVLLLVAELSRVHVSE